MDCLKDSEGDQVFAMAIAEKQQGDRGMADTIVGREWLFPCGGMAKW